MTADNSELLALAERCEAATGSDVYLSREIAIAVGKYDPGHWLDYSGSLHAAMALVPDTWSAAVVRIPGHPAEASVLEFELRGDKYWRVAGAADSGKRKAATPALALSAAALRARAAQ